MAVVDYGIPFFQNVPLYMCPTMAVNKLITIEPVPFELPLADESGHFMISPPSAHTGVGPVMARLISSEYRSGQVQYFVSPQLYNCPNDTESYY